VKDGEGGEQVQTQPGHYTYSSHENAKTITCTPCCIKSISFRLLRHGKKMERKSGKWAALLSRSRSIERQVLLVAVVENEQSRSTFVEDHGLVPTFSHLDQLKSDLCRLFRRRGSASTSNVSNVGHILFWRDVDRRNGLGVAVCGWNRFCFIFRC